MKKLFITIMLIFIPVLAFSEEIFIEVSNLDEINIRIVVKFEGKGEGKEIVIEGTKERWWKTTLYPISPDSVSVLVANKDEKRGAIFIEMESLILRRASAKGHLAPDTFFDLEYEY